MHGLTNPKFEFAFYYVTDVQTPAEMGNEVVQKLWIVILCIQCTFHVSLPLNRKPIRRSFCQPFYSIPRGFILSIANHKQASCYYESNQQDALYRLIYYSKSALHVSGDVTAHHQEHLTLFTVSGGVHPRCHRLVSWMSCSNLSKTQPAATWVNTTRYCKYSQVLPMMGKNNARNM